MKAPWEYLDNLNEIVYVIDTESNEVIYMNQYAMDKFSLKEKEDYYRKKCFVLLQGRSEACPFCNTADLEKKKFIEWSYQNPVLRQPFLLKDTFILWEGKKCRMEIVIDPEEGSFSSNSLIRCESLINDCLIQANISSDPEQSLDTILKIAGEKLQCARADIYEVRELDLLTHSYSWRAEGEAEEEWLEEEELSSLLKWYEEDCGNNTVLITDVDRVKEEDVKLVRRMKRSGVHVFILIPLMHRMELRGFIRLDDPKADTPVNVAEMGRMLSHFIFAILERRDFWRHLEYQGYHDHLTNALNRYALSRRVEEGDFSLSTGIVACDIIGLKSVNDLQGYLSGDRMIVRVYEALTSLFSPDDIYRVGGGEFLVLSCRNEESEFNMKLALLRDKATENNFSLSVGSIWVPEGEKNLRELIKTADEKMYLEKERFYSGNAADDKGGYRQCKSSWIKEQKRYKTEDPFRRFIREYRFDSDVFFRAIASEGGRSFYFCGDIGKDVYFISDSLKKEFNFSENLVYDFETILKQRIHQNDLDRYTGERNAVIEEKREWSNMQFRIYNANDRPVWVQCQSVIKWNKKKTEITFLAGMMIPIENEYRPEAERKNLSHLLKRISGHAGCKKELLFVCFSLNSFSVVNKLLGSQTGDTVLWEITNRIARDLGDSISLTCLGGVRFLIFSEEIVDSDSIVGVVRRTVQAIYASYRIPVARPCSIGVLRRPCAGINEQELMENVNIVLEMAKQEKEKNYVEFSPELAENYEYQTERDLSLNRCINNDFENFRIVIQPQVTAAEGKVYGGEVLLRWRFRDKDIPSSEFIPILEDSGLIGSVGNWVFMQAVHAFRKIREICPEFQLSVNVSYQQMMDRDFAEFIRKTLEDNGVSGENIVLELTETHLNERPELFEQFVQQCKSIGIRFALDDFGTAYSSLQLLLEYPADIVKLERSLTREIASSKEKLDFVESIVYACHKFGKKVCVEGVEKTEELEIVRQTDSDFIQGFYFYRPQELESLYQVLSEEKNAGKLYEKK